MDEVKHSAEHSETANTEDDVAIFLREYLVSIFR